jgi:hypothetical protein
MYRVSVICSYLNLTALPSTVPEKTIFLDASNNEVSSLYSRSIDQSDELFP